MAESGGARYRAEIHESFLDGVNLPPEFTERNIAKFLKAIPLIKQNIVIHGRRSLEVEYEQMIIRANNFEPRNNTEYFIVDRQYALKADRFDLTGIFWDRKGRRRNQEVPVCLMEIKFALNADINKVADQMARYYESIRPRAAEIAGELQKVFRQKLELGLVQQSAERLDALKTLSFTRCIDHFQFILVLVDYNPNSDQLDLGNLSKLPFADQVKVFFSGFGMWRQNVEPLSSYVG